MFDNTQENHPEQNKDGIGLEQLQVKGGEGKILVEKTNIFLKNCSQVQEMQRRRVASFFCLTERTYSRRLRACEERFESLVEQEIRSRVMTMMLNGLTSGRELAERLGYSGSAYFYQWFRRSVGITFKNAKIVLSQNQSNFVSIFDLNSKGIGYSEKTDRSKGKQFSINNDHVYLNYYGDKNMNGKNTAIRELTFDEIEEVSGGIAPLVGWGIALGLGFSIGFGASYFIYS